MKSRYVYPCIVTHDKNEGIYYIQFVDFKEAFTDAQSLEESIVYAKEVLELCLYEYFKLNKEIPEPSTEGIKTKENEYLIYVDVWIPPILDKIQNQSVKKTLTIPFWLNEEAEKYKVNFSLLLQTALKEYLGIK